VELGEHRGRGRGAEKVWSQVIRERLKPILESQLSQKTISICVGFNVISIDFD
jgi:hypothetical protein